MTTLTAATVDDRLLERAIKTILRVWRDGGAGYVAFPNPDAQGWVIGKIDRAGAREIIEHYFTKFLFEDLKRNRAQWFWTGAPYCIVRLKPRLGEPERWLALNRLYKPLGIPNYAPLVDYEAYKERGIVFGLDPGSLDGVWSGTRPGDYLHHLYNDDPRSLRDYFSRLCCLDDAVERAARSNSNAKKRRSRLRSVKGGQ